MYRFSALSFEYVPSCPTTTTGEFAMAFDYDVLDSDVANEITSMRGAVVGQLYARHTMRYEPSCQVVPSHKFFCSATDADRLNDVGKFVYCARGTTAAVSGTLFVHYTVQLFNAEPAGDTFARGLSVKHSDGTDTNPIGTIETLRATAAAAQDTIVQLLNVTNAVAASMGGIPKLTTPIGGVLPKTSLLTGLLFSVQERQHRWSCVPGSDVYDEGEEDFLNDADTYVVWVDNQTCSEGICLLPSRGNWTADGTAGPTVVVTTSTNLTVTAMYNVSSPPTYTTSTLTAARVSAWYRYEFSGNSNKAWMQVTFTGGTWDETSQTNWTYHCEVNQDDWDPLYVED